MVWSKIPSGRRFDLACLGRLAVDLYAEQFGARLEDVTSFAKYLGGSSANIAFGAARLGLRSAMISRVGNEQMGQFLLEQLQREDCDTSMVQRDPDRLTGLVLLGLKDRETFPLLFYRENCADMALEAAEIDEAFIADCRALLITGTHLSTAKVRQASHLALDYAQKHGTFRVLDIDYRPVLWGLTHRGEGANRFVPSRAVTEQLQQSLPHFDLLIGTVEEFMIAGGGSDLIDSLRQVRRLTAAAMVVKLGADGCCLIDGAVPDQLSHAPTVAGEKIEVFNVLGAGDAFAAGLMKGLLSGQDFIAAARLANACGALVVSRHACAPAMPSLAELDYWFKGRDKSESPQPLHRDHQLQFLHRVSVKRKQWPEVMVLAFDHRSQFYELVKKTGSAESRLPRLKSLLLQGVQEMQKSPDYEDRLGVLIDGDYGADALARATGSGLWIGRSIELPSSRPLRFYQTLSVGSELRSWPREQVVKCLVFYHPDDEPELRLEQEARLHELWAATRASGHELLLEIIPPADSVTAATHDRAILRSIKRLYNIGLRPEWWKLPPLESQAWQDLASLVAERDPYCRGAVILGLNQRTELLVKAFKAANSPLVKGFMIGRTIWGEAAEQWLRNQIDDQQFQTRCIDNFKTLIAAWREAR
ncbi:MAG: 5-dehydro-2-deoxygluconokinase [Candidatus Pacebacteria bacterium]|nr:5-dehydro-2-deoxygluconokinase [Candidatus Paceibacterota bacterium]